MKIRSFRSTDAENRMIEEIAKIEQRTVTKEILWLFEQRAIELGIKFPEEKKETE